MDILIFKTNLNNPERIHRAQPIIQNMQGIKRWNIDIHDCDNVLRIESTELTARLVESVLKNAGYYCEELQD